MMELVARNAKAHVNPIILWLLSHTLFRQTTVYFTKKAISPFSPLTSNGILVPVSLCTSGVKFLEVGILGSKVMNIFVEYCLFVLLAFMIKNRIIFFFLVIVEDIPWVPPDSLGEVSSWTPWWALPPVPPTLPGPSGFHTLGLTSCVLRRTSFIAAIIKPGQAASHPELRAPPTISGFS